MKTLRPNCIRVFPSDQKEQKPHKMPQAASSWSNARAAAVNPIRGLRGEGAHSRLAYSGILCIHLSQHS